jgi:hypothetical protein
MNAMKNCFHATAEKQILPAHKKPEQKLHHVTIEVQQLPALYPKPASNVQFFVIPRAYSGLVSNIV